MTTDAPLSPVEQALVRALVGAIAGELRGDNEGTKKENSPHAGDTKSGEPVTRRRRE